MNDKGNSHSEIMRILGNLEGSQKEVLRRFDRQDEWMKDHDKRVSSIETSMASQAGAARVWGIVTAAGTSIIFGIGQYLLGRIGISFNK